MRTIYHPSSKVKLIQYWLMNNVFRSSQCIMLHMHLLKPINKSNALLHAESKNKYYVKIDLKDFFPSIKFTDFEYAFTRYRDRIEFTTEYDKELLQLIKRSALYQIALSYRVSYISINCKLCGKRT